MAITLDGTTGISSVDGSAASPSVRGADANSGIVYAADTVAISTAGSEKARIDSSGKLGLGTTSPQVTGIHINGSSARLQLTDGTTGAASGDGVIFGLNGSQDFFINNRETSKNLLFFTEGNERVRVNNGGRVDIGGHFGTEHGSHFQVVNTTTTQSSYDCLSYFETAAVDWCIKTNYNVAGSHYHLFMEEQGTNRGMIHGSDGSNVQYAGGSDYRWKENVVEMTGTEGIDICKKLKPSYYNWIDNRVSTGKINTVDGFIAHEVEEAGIKGAVWGEKDAVNEDGSVKGQMLDYGQITPALAAAIKGLITKIETLETKVAALEAA